MVYHLYISFREEDNGRLLPTCRDIRMLHSFCGFDEFADFSRRSGYKSDISKIEKSNISCKLKYRRRGIGTLYTTYSYEVFIDTGRINRDGKDWIKIYDYFDKALLSRNFIIKETDTEYITLRLNINQERGNILEYHNSIESVPKALNGKWPYIWLNYPKRGYANLCYYETSKTYANKYTPTKADIQRETSLQASKIKNYYDDLMKKSEEILKKISTVSVMENVMTAAFTELKRMD